MRPDLKNSTLLQKPADCERCGKHGLGMCINGRGQIVCRKGPCKRKKGKTKNNRE